MGGAAGGGDPSDPSVKMVSSQGIGQRQDGGKELD